MDDTERATLERIGTYQFGRGAGPALFADPEDLEVTYSTSGRPRQVHASDGRLVSLGTDGRFTLGLAGGHRLQAALDAPAYRVVVGDESAPYVREERNVFAKFVQSVDGSIRPGDEVLVVHHDGTLLAVGRAELSATGMADFDTGMAVSVREGAGEGQ
ncbi:pseudouridine synthase [Halapricum sp. CBA1109]|uniref:PUA domain-containing protein n=1 Tax=Halapricum sp. CBA1109 TaxID=2668068 RepID=UPI0012F86CEE|nr:PUA domain-containing protein [Halapricum sp. CBA1109]MUV90654.1 pseudouridine synthase [Halapricum sp. CBA1109]